MNHEIYSVNVSFIVCPGMKDKVLEEIRALMDYVQKNSLSHASNLKIKVNSMPATEVEMH